MSLGDVTNPNSLSSRLRNRRDVKVRALIDHVHGQRNQVEIIDVGGTFEYWKRLGVDYLRSRNASVVVTNLHEYELTDAGADSDVLRATVANGCDLGVYGNQSFDLAHSNSVIEHVGPWSNMRAFAAEIRRVGRAYYVQTPNFWCPIDPHYYRAPLIHWLPHPLRARIFNAFPVTHSGRIDGVGGAYEVIESTRLLDSRQLQYLFPDGSMSVEWAFGLPKSLITIRQGE